MYHRNINNMFSKFYEYILRLLASFKHSDTIFHIFSSTDGCVYLNGLKKQVCPFVPPELNCDCPLKAGKYGGDNVTIPMPQMGSIMKFIASVCISLLHLLHFYQHEILHSFLKNESNCCMKH